MDSLLVTFGAIRLFLGAESFFPIMANATVFALREIGLGHFEITLFRLENFGMAVSAFNLMLVDVALMTENDWR